MRFNLVDRIVQVEPGRKIIALKRLTLGEEYLADHFPSFPVMPGVLMLQTLVEASSWLLRLSEEFRHSVIVLREARNVKYGSFMEPGKTLTVTSEVVENSREESSAFVSFKARGDVEGTATVSARLTLTRYNLRDRNPAWQEIDNRIVAQLRIQSALLLGQLAG